MRRGEEKMERNFLILTIFVFVCTFSGCEKNVSESKPQNSKSSQSAVNTPLATPWIPKDGNYEGRGVVTKINNDLGSVEINHEDIKDMMPAMRMEFFVKDKSLLKGLAVSDKVDFVVEYKHPQEIIINIKKAQ
jgi:Cu/Ag efflux protein CusF